MSINYSYLPEHCIDGMKRYIEDGIVPGSFLQVVICNNLVEAFGRADDINIHRLFDYAKFLHNEAPFECWGSREAMVKWADKKRKERSDANHEQA